MFFSNCGWKRSIGLRNCRVRSQSRDVVTANQTVSQAPDENESTDIPKLGEHGANERGTSYERAASSLQLAIPRLSHLIEKTECNLGMLCLDRTKRLNIVVVAALRLAEEEETDGGCAVHGPGNGFEARAVRGCQIADNVGEEALADKGVNVGGERDDGQGGKEYVGDTGACARGFVKLELGLHTALGTEYVVREVGCHGVVELVQELV